MDRRTFIASLAGGLLAAPLVAEAQQPGKIVRIALFSTGQVRSAPFNIAFEKRLRELGYIEGQNAIVEFRTAEGKAERVSGIMAELARLKPDLIVAGGPEAVLQAARQATTTIPIVFIAIEVDPVLRGYIGSLARPGGNVTGVFLRQPELAVKRVDLLREMLPKVTRVAVFGIRSLLTSSKRQRPQSVPSALNFKPWNCHRRTISTAPSSSRRAAVRKSFFAQLRPFSGANARRSGSSRHGIGCP